MTTKLLITALVALSVAKLEAALVADTYTVEELTEALGLEQAKDAPRVTAIEAIQEAIALAEQPEPAKAPKGLRVPKGKALVTKAGIKAEGELITADMVTGGAERLALLKTKGLLV